MRARVPDVVHYLLSNFIYVTDVGKKVMNIYVRYYFPLFIQNSIIYVIRVCVWEHLQQILYLISQI